MASKCNWIRECWPLQRRDNTTLVIDCPIHLIGTPHFEFGIFNTLSASNAILLLSFLHACSRKVEIVRQHRANGLAAPEN